MCEHFGVRCPLQTYYYNTIKLAHLPHTTSVRSCIWGLGKPRWPCIFRGIFRASGRVRRRVLTGCDIPIYQRGAVDIIDLAHTALAALANPEPPRIAAPPRDTQAPPRVAAAATYPALPARAGAAAAAAAAALANEVKEALLESSLQSLADAGRGDDAAVSPRGHQKAGKRSGLVEQAIGGYETTLNAISRRGVTWLRRGVALLSRHLTETKQIAAGVLEELAGLDLGRLKVDETLVLRLLRSGG